MPTAILIEKVLAPTLAAVAALLTCAAVWATTLAGTGTAPSVIHANEFSGPSTQRPQPVRVVAEPQSGRGLHRVRCAGVPAGSASCYVATP